MEKITEKISDVRKNFLNERIETLKKTQIEQLNIISELEQQLQEYKDREDYLKELANNCINSEADISPYFLRDILNESSDEQ